jgi:hypothetical protein
MCLAAPTDAVGVARQSGSAPRPRGRHPCTGEDRAAALAPRTPGKAPLRRCRRGRSRSGTALQSVLDAGESSPKRRRQHVLLAPIVHRLAPPSAAYSPVRLVLAAIGRSPASSPLVRILDLGAGASADTGASGRMRGSVPQDHGLFLPEAPKTPPSGLGEPRWTLRAGGAKA